mmetsp:Transcript_36857/g.92381  ORF Transcript_36857/g.92381 Transcript_36857/m.92381 type:complete len:480 (+) Transcript_36857:98-1537(+)
MCALYLSEETDHPLQELKAIASEAGRELTSKALAAELDSRDPLAHCRSRFRIPHASSSSSSASTLGSTASSSNTSSTSDVSSGACPWLYFCGNSLGLQPRATPGLINEELEIWANLGVEGHFASANKVRPWADTDLFVQKQSARLVGAQTEEVAIMNSLTVNLHLLMIAFYKPTKDRYRIIVEGGAFPSDRYALESQAQLHNLDPKDTIVELHPREGERTLRTEDILDTIRAQGDKLALVLMSGVQYYTGQYFDIPSITSTAHSVGALAGFDLAHAVGNVPLRLHDWEVDFACWCTYKYLNSGPGNIGGAFVHMIHGKRHDLHRLSGWWGHNAKTRFDMTKPFDPIPGALGFRLSNPPVLCVTALLASLQEFERVSMEQLRQKSLLLTAYLEHLLLSELGSDCLEIITPKNFEERGCQLSLLFHDLTLLDKVVIHFEKHHVCCDVRKPNVIRVAPVPLYNRFVDVYHFVRLLKEVVVAK